MDIFPDFLKILNVLFGIFKILSSLELGVQKSALIGLDVFIHEGGLLFFLRWIRESLGLYFLDSCVGVHQVMNS
mgnify:CR=1 FL=1